MARGPGKGNTNNPNGKPKGVPNKITTEAKEVIKCLVEGRMNGMEDILDVIARKDPSRYMEIMIKLMQFVVPRQSQTDVTSSDGSMKIKPEITVTSKEAKEALERVLNEDD